MLKLSPLFHTTPRPFYQLVRQFLRRSVNRSKSTGVRPTEFWWRRGKLKIRTREVSAGRIRTLRGFFRTAHPANYRDLPLVVPQGQ